ncbi:MAG: Cbp1 family collagen-binding glycoprotein adhesin [Paludibacteraceae bacterium]
MKNILIFTAVLLFLASCGQQQKGEVERLKTENDSLQNSKLQLEEEVNDYFATLNNVQENIEKIKSTQNSISVQPLSENTPQNVRDKVVEDMAYINELIKTNQNEIEKMRTKMKRSTFQLDNLEKTLESLTKQLNNESAKVVRLHKQLQIKDSVITKLGSTVDELGKNVEDLSQKNLEKENVIQQQDEAINSGWYAIGSVKELKDNKIISSEGIFSIRKVLQSDFNKNYFVKVDTRNTKSIPLYSKSKAKVLTNHPKSSYTFQTENGNLVLVITNPDQFWSVSKYLVVEVD